MRKKSITVLSKGELFSSRANWQSARSGVQKNARRVWIKSGRLFKCSVCGYDKHAEIAHIKSVSDFSDDILIRDINAIDNLVALCPNHHWEFDNLSPGEWDSSKPHKLTSAGSNPASATNLSQRCSPGEQRSHKPCLGGPIPPVATSLRL